MGIVTKVAVLQSDETRGGSTRRQLTPSGILPTAETRSLSMSILAIALLFGV
jgi:hypothetical protein